MASEFRATRACSNSFFNRPKLGAYASCTTRWQASCQRVRLVYFLSPVGSSASWRTKTQTQCRAMREKTSDDLSSLVSHPSAISQFLTRLKRVPLRQSISCFLSPALKARPLSPAELSTPSRHTFCKFFSNKQTCGARIRRLSFWEPSEKNHLTPISIDDGQREFALNCFCCG